MTSSSASAAVTVRRASVGDAAEISVLNAYVQELHANAMPWLFKSPSDETFPPGAAAAILAREDALVYLASMEEKPVGYIYAQVLRHPETSYRHALEQVYVHHISVRPHYRGRGVGSALLDAVNRAAEALDIKQVALDVWWFNESAREYFRKRGFDSYNLRMCIG